MAQWVVQKMQAGIIKDIDVFLDQPWIANKNSMTIIEKALICERGVESLESP